MIIHKAAYLISSANISQCPAPTKPEYAFIGRSNVGKSSLINMLCNNEKLAKTSGTPGKTQLINHFDLVTTTAVPIAIGKEHKAITQDWYLVDLPGYGFAKVSLSSRRKWEQMIEQYLRNRENLTQVFVLIDSRHSPQKIDLQFLENLKKWEIPFSLVFTKSDKEKQTIVSKNVKDFLNAMRKTWMFLPQHFVTSATKKRGKDKIMEYIGEMNLAVTE